MQLGALYMIYSTYGGSWSLRPINQLVALLIEANCSWYLNSPGNTNPHSVSFASADRRKSGGGSSPSFAAEGQWGLSATMGNDHTIKTVLNVACLVQTRVFSRYGLVRSRDPDLVADTERNEWEL